MLSLLKFWNYRRTPNRGAAHVTISLDDAIVYDGLLARAPPLTPASGDFCQSIVFNNDPKVLDAEGPNVRVVDESEFGSEVRLFDRSVRMEWRGGGEKETSEQGRPATAVVNARHEV